jgi:hypothetical protein
MTETLDITVENRFRKEKRDISIYHHASRGAHIISDNSSITLSLDGAERDDYLDISVVHGPGHLWKDCWINLPSRVDFEFSSNGKAAITHLKERILLKIPPGLPTWQLKITRTAAAPGSPLKDKITIGDNKPGEI